MSDPARFLNDPAMFVLVDEAMVDLYQKLAVDHGYSEASIVVGVVFAPPYSDTVTGYLGERRDHRISRSRIYEWVRVTSEREAAIPDAEPDDA